jgi:adenine-specific DNA-methyltransferase
MNQLFCGDNLAVMSGLPEELVDFCLFDPPYNTGSKSLPYPDRRPDWTGYMAPRLAAARRLLKSSGCLACHIDDHELENLLRILREVFGKKNFLANISWVTSRGGSFGNISHITEPILVYAKDRKSLRLPIVHSPTKNDHQFTNPDNDPAGRWRSQIKAGRNREHRYAIQDYTTGEFVFPTYSWHCKPEEMVAKFARCGIVYQYRSERLELISPPPSSSVLPKYYFDKNVLRRKEYLSQRNSRKASLHTLIDEPGTMAVEGVKEYHRIMGKSFDFPTVKPLALAEKLIRHLCPEKGVVLDAFAGTGTSGQAAHKQNRPFILIEDRVANIASERLRRVGIQIEI